MATFRKTPNGSWRAEVAIGNVRKSKVKKTKQAAKEWARAVEHELDMSVSHPDRIVFSDVLKRYADEVSPTKGGEIWEIRQIKRLRKSDLGAKLIGDIDATDIVSWRDDRLKTVQASTVNREWNLISNVFSTAVREWLHIKVNPMTHVRRPKDPRPRNRTEQEGELERLAWTAGDDLSTRTARTFHAFLFALETAMRAGEIVGLTWDRIDLDRQVLQLHETKNGESREVSLSVEAVRLLSALPEVEEGQPVFGLSSSQMEPLWRKLCGKAAVVGLHFHDSRRIATTRCLTSAPVGQI